MRHFLSQKFVRAQFNRVFPVGFAALRDEKNLIYFFIDSEFTGHHMEFRGKIRKDDPRLKWD